MNQLLYGQRTGAAVRARLAIYLCGGGAEGETAWMEVADQTPCLAFRLTLE